MPIDRLLVVSFQYRHLSRMESLNLNTLANSLPNAQQNAEKELLNDFKGPHYFLEARF